MICYCGHDLGRVTLKTDGLCDHCRRSKWLQLALAILPKSERIAAGLARRGDKCCIHMKTVCYSICGVELRGGYWRAIVPLRRRVWFQNVGVSAED